VSDNGSGAEAIVSIGGGVTVMVVHEAGLPRFVRVLGLGGRLLTEAIGRELQIPFDQAEALKRQSNQVPEQIAERARLAMQRPLSDVIEQIRGSLDYYRAQPSSPRLLRVTLTGGASLTPGLPEQLRDLIGIPVEPATPRDQLEIGDIGFPDDRVDTLDPYLPTPAGLALGGLASGRRINLVGGEGDAAKARQRAIAIGAVIAVLLLVALGGIWWIRKSALNTEQDRLAQTKSEVAQLEVEKASLSDAEQAQAELEELKGEAETVLAQDVSWPRMLQEISRTIPNDTWLTSFQGTLTPPVNGSSGAGTIPLTPSGGSTPPSTTLGPDASAGGAPETAATPIGTVTFSVVGLDFRSVSAWIQRLGTQVPSFSDLWVPSASRGASTADASGRSFVDFSSNATITSEAQSDRLEKLQRGVK
jgi:type IV pilus assembly protein PilM